MAKLISMTRLIETNIPLTALTALLMACNQGSTPQEGTGHQSAKIQGEVPTGSANSNAGTDSGKPLELVGPAPHHGPSKGSILMVAANPALSKQTGWPIGVWAAELTHPYHAFIQAGYTVTFASPDGGKVEFDGYSDPNHESGYSAHDLLSLGFMNSPKLMRLLDDTLSVRDAQADNYDAIFLVGGQSPMYTFRHNQELMKFVAAFYESGKPTAAVCHATAIFLDTKLSTGRLLVDGKTWTGFANAEEQYADQAVGQKIQPFWIEEEARALEGTSFVVKPAFTEYAVRDGNLITGQQQNSGVAVARLVLDVLEAS